MTGEQAGQPRPGARAYDADEDPPGHPARLPPPGGPAPGRRGHGRPDRAHRPGHRHDDRRATHRR